MPNKNSKPPERKIRITGQGKTQKIFLGDLDISAFVEDWRLERDGKIPTLYLRIPALDIEAELPAHIRTGNPMLFDEQLASWEASTRMGALDGRVPSDPGRGRRHEGSTRGRSFSSNSPLEDILDPNVPREPDESTSDPETGLRAASISLNELGEVMREGSHLRVERDGSFTREFPASLSFTAPPSAATVQRMREMAENESRMREQQLNRIQAQREQVLRDMPTTILAGPGPRYRTSPFATGVAWNSPADANSIRGMTVHSEIWDETQSPTESPNTQVETVDVPTAAETDDTSF